MTLDRSSESNKSVLKVSLAVLQRFLLNVGNYWSKASVDLMGHRRADENSWQVGGGKTFGLFQGVQRFSSCYQENEYMTGSVYGV